MGKLLLFAQHLLKVPLQSSIILKAQTFAELCRKIPPKRHKPLTMPETRRNVTSLRNSLLKGWIRLKEMYQLRQSENANSRLKRHAGKLRYTIIKMRTLDYLFSHISRNVLYHLLNDRFTIKAITMSPCLFYPIGIILRNAKRIA